MAATMSSVWSKPGAWALESEENEADLLRQSKEELINKPDADLSDFPSLSAAAATKSKKKKPQTLSLSEFAKYSKPAPRGPTFQDLASLPTGPRERTAEELDRSKLGGGFRSYGGYDRNRNADGDDSSNSRWGSSRVSDEPRRQGGFGNSDSQSSRADDVDDWGAGKKTLTNNGPERRDRGDRGGFFGSESKADESDSWVSNKSFVPSEGGRRFEGHRERRVGFESNAGSDSDNWGKKKEEEGRKIGAGAGAGAFDSLRERRGGFDSGDSAAWGKKRDDVNGSVRPKLNLQPRSLPVVKDNQLNGSEAPAKPKTSNPFGEARPREEVLKEKGQDWKEIDDKLESLKMKETTTGGRRSFFENEHEKINLSEAKGERSWRKPESNDAIPQGCRVEEGNGNGGETGGGEEAVITED